MYSLTSQGMNKCSKKEGKANQFHIPAKVSIEQKKKYATRNNVMIRR